MGLLDDAYTKAKHIAGLLSDYYQTGAQLYFPNEGDVKARPELAKGLLQFIPGPGDAISGYDAVQSARKGNYGEASLNGIGLLPFVPAMGGMVSPLKKQAREAYNANKEIFDNAHRADNMTFNAIPIADLKDAVSIHKSTRYGNKAPSEYMVAIVNGEPAYVRKSDHWGKFTTNVYKDSPEAKAMGLLGEEGDQFGRVGYKGHNWELLGGITSQQADRLAELRAARDAMSDNERLGEQGIKLWDEIYKILRPGKREAGYIPLSKLKDTK